MNKKSKELDHAAILKMYSETDKSPKSIGDLFGTSPYIIRSILKSNGIEVKSKKYITFTESEISLIVDAYNSGIPVYKIGEHLGLSGDFKKVLKSAGVEVKNKNYTEVSKEQIKYVIDGYLDGMGVIELSAYLGIKNPTLVNNILADAGVDMNTSRDIHKKRRYDKVKSTNLERYGVGNQFQRKEIIESNYTPELNSVRQVNCQASNLKNYGVSNVFQLDDIKEKSKATNLREYGDENFVNTDAYKGICMDKYGVDHASKSDKVKLVNRATCLGRYGTTSASNIHLSERTMKTIESPELLAKLYVKCNTSMHLMSLELGDINKSSLYKRLVSYGIYEKSHTSELELMVEDVLINNDISYVNNKKLTGCNFRPDFIIEEFKLVIECDGLYWHCDKVDDGYHRAKFDAYNSLGYKMLSFHTGELLGKFDIVKSMILNSCGKSSRVFARKCEIKEVSNKESNRFLIKNHIQGIANSSIQFGLYYDGLLVSLMTFSKCRRSGVAEYELLRFCNSIGVSVVGGASKLLKHFIRLNGSSILSYSENRRGNGQFYSILGFEMKSDNKIGYYYTNDYYTLEGREKYQKKKLEKLFPEIFDINKTERTIMSLAGYERYNTCGTRTWLYIYI